MATPLRPLRKEQRGWGPAYRDVRNAFLALVGHGPSGALRPAGGPVGLSFALSGARSVPLSAGAATKAREGEERDGGSAPALPTRSLPRLFGPPAAAAPAASTARLGGGREEEGEARAGGGGCRQTAPPGGAEQSRIRPSRLEPGSASLPIPPLRPPPPQPPSPADPRPAHTPSAGPRPRSRAWEGLVLRVLLEARDGVRMRRQSPRAAPQVCGPASAGLPQHLPGEGGCGPGAGDPPKLLSVQGPPRSGSAIAPLRPLVPQPPFVHLPRHFLNRPTPVPSPAPSFYSSYTLSLNILPQTKVYPFSQAHLQWVLDKAFPCHPPHLHHSASLPEGSAGPSLPGRAAAVGPGEAKP